MNKEELEKTAKKMVANGKGILAADESANTCKKRFDAVGVESTAENRRRYRQILVTTHGVSDHLSGIIFYDETFWQSTSDNQPFREVVAEQGILPGIKVDLGLEDLPGFEGEKISKGLDTLPERIAEYADYGAKFAKWRSVITIGDGKPTNECIGANTFVLSRYARICQDYNVVPIVEPEILFDGHHSIEQCEETAVRTFETLFQTMRAFRVHLPGAVLKTSMVLPGKDSGQEINHDDVAERTARVLHEHVPSELGGVVFLSGGQSSDDAFKNLNKIAQRGPHPWGVTFSYSRAIQDSVLKAWAKHEQEPWKLYLHQLDQASKARSGELDVVDEHSDDEDEFVSGSQDL